MGEVPPPASSVSKSGSLLKINLRSQAVNHLPAQAGDDLQRPAFYGYPNARLDGWTSSKIEQRVVGKRNKTAIMSTTIWVLFNHEAGSSQHVHMQNLISV